MAELIVVAVILGILILAAWPLAAARTRARNPREQDEVTGTEPVPPRAPDEPLPGSRTRREQHGRA